MPGHDRPGARARSATSARTIVSFALGAGRSGPDRDLDRRARPRRGPRPTMSSIVLPAVGLAVDCDDLVADLDPGLLGRAALEDADDERQAVRRRIDPDADADELAGQVVRALGALLGSQERGVAGVADGLGHAVDGAVDEVAVVELIRPRRTSCAGCPRLRWMRPKSVGDGAVGSRVGDPRLPKAGSTRLPTPIPTLNVNTSASPMTARRTIDRVHGRPPVTPRPGRGRARLASRPVARRRWSVRSGSDRSPSSSCCSCGGTFRRAALRRPSPDALSGRPSMTQSRGNAISGR